MRILIYLLQKEFTQIFRNKSMLPIIFVMPIVQLMVLVFASTFEVKRIDIAVVDFDHSNSSSKLISQIESNSIFHINYYPENQDKAEKLIQSNKIDLSLCIPKDFDKKLGSAGKPEVQILADAIVGNSAQLGVAYLTQIIGDFNKSVLVKQRGGVPSGSGINIESSFWYNAELNYKIYMAPGILVVLITIVGMMLGGMNLVREKELGTIEQINVTPIKKWQLLAGKLIPFLIIGLFELGFGLTIAHIAFGMPMRGSLGLLLGGATIYLILVLSAGLFLSTISDTQQQVTFSTYFFMMIFIMLSGLFTPVESMPQWAQYLDRINPLFYFVRIMRSVILKGAEFKDLWWEFTTLAGYALTVFSLAIFKYRKTT